MSGGYFVKQGNCYMPSNGSSREIFDKLPGGIYLLKVHPMMGFYLEESPAFEIPKKLYGHHAADAERILSTFESRPSTTGVMLAGDKGTGKTLVAKIVCTQAARAGIPTLLVNEAFVGDPFNSFLTSFNQPIVLFLDEFEKVYDKEKQPALLTLMDGVFSGKRLFMLTTNDKWKVDSHMQNRPGRLYYMLEYAGVETEFIREYCEDKLENKEHIDSVCVLGTIFSEFNFDMLQAIVEEMNRYKEDAMQALKWLNCKITYARDDYFTVTLKRGDKVYTGKQLHNNGRWVGSPMTAENIEVYYKINEPVAGQEEPDMDEEDFDKADLVRMDVKTGEFIFKNTSGAQLKLKRDKRKQDVTLSNIIGRYYDPVVAF